MKKNNVKLLTSYSTIAILFGTIQMVYAHAGFKDAMLSGEGGSARSSTWNAIEIPHGCIAGGADDGLGAKDVMALSAVFPNDPTGKNIYRKSAGKVAIVGKETDVTTTEVDFPNDIESGLPLSLVVVTVGNMFANTIPIADGNNNLRGWQTWNGIPLNGQNLLESKTNGSGINNIMTSGLAPFKLGSSIIFKAASCAKTLQIRVAVADWCEKGKSSKTTKDGARADIWIGTLTHVFNDPALMPNSDGTIYWPTLTVTRDLINNPLPKSCSSTDADTLYIEPNPADIDAYLPISNKKYPAGAGQNTYFWPTSSN